MNPIIKNMNTNELKQLKTEINDILDNEHQKENDIHFKNMQNVFIQAFNSLLSLPYRDASIFEKEEFILNNRTICLNVPRVSGKTEFLKTIYEKFDGVLFLKKFRFPLDVGTEVNNYLRQEKLSNFGFMPTFPYKIVLFDEQVPTYDIIHDLLVLKKIDTDTKIFCLHTSS